MTDYKAKISDFDEREEAAQLYSAMLAAEKAYYNAPSRVLTPEQYKAVDAISAEFLRRKADLDHWCDSEHAKATGPDPNAHLAEASSKAADAYDAHPGGAIREDDDGNPARCAVSGAILYENDDVIEIGDHLVLMSLFVPAEIIAMLKPEDDDDDSEVEIVEAAE